VVCRQADMACVEACALLNDAATALCVKIERDFLKALLGGCSTPISALAEITNNEVIFKGNIVSPDGTRKVETSATALVKDAATIGAAAASDILQKGGREITDRLQHAAG
jgi:hydroxymethylbilane synthase